jgi:hydrogenase nickel incorporation protein HypA/HybF
MHEVSIAESIIDIASDYAGREGIDRFHAVELEIGAFSGIEIDALTFAMEVVCRDTVLDGAALHINEVSGWGKCDMCFQEFQLEDCFMLCPHCGETSVSILRGQELRVASLIVNE